MKRTREIIVLILCALSELGLFFQFYRPVYFLETDIIEKGTVSWTIPRAIVLIAMVAMFLFAVSIIWGNLNGLLHISYAVYLLYFVIVLVVLFAQRRQVKTTLSNDYLHTNLIVYIVTAVIAIFTLLLFILREKGGIRLIPKMSSLLLLVMLGQFVTHGFIVGGGSIYISKLSILCGICSIIPYFTIYVFEKSILEPTIREYR